MPTVTVKPHTILYEGIQTDGTCHRCRTGILIPDGWYWIPFGINWFTVRLCRKCAEEHQRKWKGQIIKYSHRTGYGPVALSATPDSSANGPGR